VTLLDHHELGTWSSQYSLVVSWFDIGVAQSRKALYSKA
jgi:hypothetical protein